jgi:hypothetical protein
MTTLAEHHKIASLESKACAAAVAVGLIAKRSRFHVPADDSPDGFMIFDPKHQRTVAGEEYDLSAQDVIAYCKRLGRSR